MSLADLRRNNKQTLDKILAKSKKINKVSSAVKSTGTDKINDLCRMVQNKLGHLADKLTNIQTEQEFISYIDKCIVNNEIAIDTETNGLDPISDKIVGLCIYTPREKGAYVPINHVSRITGTRLNNQITPEQIKIQLQRIVDNNVKTIFFNAKFDIRVIWNQIGIKIKPYWDAYIAAKVLKENEKEASLKYLWTKYCSDNKESDYFTFDKLFHGYKFSVIPIDTAYLYAGNDAVITWELYNFQKPFLTETDPKCIECGFQKLAKLYNEIELPIVSAVADIEDNGICLNVEYIKELSVKYHALLNEKLTAFNTEYDKYKDQIIQYKATHPNSKIEDPININSPTQLAELFYDVFKIPPVKKKEPRGTSEEILLKMNHPLCNLILDFRSVNKLITTYIDKMEEIINPKTHRLHCNFNQMGADTGRFSSNNPNLQNIPSHNKDIRKMFVAAKTCDVYNISGTLKFLKFDQVLTQKGKIYSQLLTIKDVIISDKQYPISEITIENDWVYVKTQTPKITVDRKHVLIGSDYSQQEPKLTADLSGDEKFIAECAAGKDAYGTVASLAFNTSYEDCLEFYPDGTVNKEGKERRSQAKSILLGICYGRTIKTIAEQLGCAEEKAQQIYNAVINGIEGLKRLTEESEEMARTLGYVETKWGRRRHIPDMQLEPYTITCTGTKNFDPFFDSEELGVINDTERLKQKYLDEISKAVWNKDKRAIKERAEKDGFHIHDNTRFIEDAKRQCVNSRIQGSAADQTKIALHNIDTCEELQEIQWKTLLLVHDEIIGECPLYFAKKGGELLVKCMIEAAKDLRTGAKCDASYVNEWYGQELDLDQIIQDAFVV